MDGKWKEPFDPYQYKNGFIEANSAQATWFVPQDLPGLAKLMGGNDAAVKKLDQSFREAKKMGFTSGNSHNQELHPEYSRIPVNYGNEPSIHTAFVFTMLGKPSLTQYWSREVVNAAFSGVSPTKGYNGDEDQGLMGTLAVLYKIGLFQMTGGTEANPEYQLGSPLFDQVTIQLDPKYYPGKSLTIKTIDNSDTNRYILSGDLNGKPITASGINHRELVKGGTLTLKMGPAK
jgi:putative alpha-1,2-mannosidase